MPREIPVGDCTVTLDDAARTVTTRFPDGSELVAIDDRSEESRARAAELGYPDTWGMHRHHDLAHGFLAAREGRPFSPTLYHAAHPGSPIGADPEERHREECKVLCFQRFVMAGDNRWDVVHWIGRSFDPDVLAADFRALVGD